MVAVKYAIGTIIQMTNESKGRKSKNSNKYYNKKAV